MCSSLFLFVLLAVTFRRFDIFVSDVVRLFAVVDDIFCLFQGHIENVALLKQQYGLNKTANEVIIVIEAYRTLRDRGPYPADQVVRDIQGKFAFILYDTTSKVSFVAAVSKFFLTRPVPPYLFSTSKNLFLTIILIISVCY